MESDALGDEFDSGLAIALNKLDWLPIFGHLAKPDSCVWWAGFTQMLGFHDHAGLDWDKRTEKSDLGLF